MSQQMSYIEYLTERINFKNANDQDYTSNQNTILFFSANDEKTYIETGKSHGFQSHAIKHMKEFNPSAIKGFIGQIRNLIMSEINNNKLQFCKLYDKDNGYISDIPLNSITQAKDGALLNTLDMINDKKLKNIRLSPIEQKLIKINYKIEKMYEKEIEFRIKHAVDIDKCNSVDEIHDILAHTRIIKFNGFRNVAQTYYLDFKTNSVVIATPDYVRTLYTYNYPGVGYKQVINNFKQKMKGVEYDSVFVKQVFKSI